MGSIKNILLHCQENEKQFQEYGVMLDNPNRLINRGWIEALQFVEEHFDVDLTTIQEKGN
tara:strand:+ start:308 stop:487 length:180 start_codon:yes stop_codon:yes gene_type:complete